MPKVGLIFLTLFTPTGIAGLNLQVMGNTIGTAMKVGSYAAGAFWAARLLAIYPNPLTYLLTAVLFLGPWYVWDCISILSDPEFPNTGFRPPLPIPGYPEPRPTDGSWLLTPTTISIVSSLLPAGAYGLTSILNSYAPGLVSPDIQSNLSYALGGTAALGMAFTLYSATRPPLGAVVTAANPLAAPIAAATAANPLAAAASALPVNPLASAIPQQGGGLPSLQDLLKGMKPSVEKHPLRESAAFLAILAIIVGGGLTLATARSKAAATA
jgi:hypothetical protein